MSLPHGVSPDDVRAWADEHFPHKLKWRGAQGTGRAPYREDKSPSFSFNAGKGTWHDFASNESGGLLALAERLGVAPPWDEEREPLPSQPKDEFRKLWDSAKPADAQHPYLRRKGVSLVEGLRQSGEVLLVPCYNEPGEIVGVERVWPDGRKMHLGSKSGVFPFGKLEPGSPVVLAEGFATAASIHEATGLPVLCTFGGSGVKRTAEALRRKHPKLEIIAATDADEAGRRAAQESGGLAVIPDGLERCDWNDYMKEHGAEATREAFMRGLEEARRAADDDGTISGLDRKIVTRTLKGGGARRTERIFGLFPRGHVTIVAGLSGAGKSLLMQALAQAGAEGGGFLGEEHPVRTAIVEGDSNEGLFTDRSMKFGWEPHDRVRWTFTMEYPDRCFSTQEALGIATFREIFEDAKPDVLYIDSLTGVDDRLDELDTTQMKVAAKVFRGLAEEYDVAVVVNHHVRKAPAAFTDKEPTLHDVSGAGALLRFCHSVYIVWNREAEQGRRTYYCRCVKDWGEPPRPFSYHVGVFGNHKTVLFNFDEGVVDQLRSASAKKQSRIAEAMRRFEGKEFTAEDISRESGASRASVAREIRRGIEEGTLKKTGAGKETRYKNFFSSFSSSSIKNDENEPFDQCLQGSILVIKDCVHDEQEAASRHDENDENVMRSKKRCNHAENRFFSSFSVRDEKDDEKGDEKTDTPTLPSASRFGPAAAAEESFLSAEDLPPPAQERYRDAYERMRRANMSHEIAHQRAMDRAREAARRLQESGEEVS